MRVNKTQRIIFFLIGIVLIVIFLVLTKSSTDPRIDFVKSTISNQQMFINVSEALEAKIDSNFHLEYRSRSGKFFLSYLNDSNRVTRYTDYKNILSDSLFKELRSLEVIDIWKFNSENFFRFKFYSPENIDVWLLYNQTGSSTELIGQFPKSYVISSQDELGKHQRQKILFKLSDRLFLYFP